LVVVWSAALRLAAVAWLAVVGATVSAWLSLAAVTVAAWLAVVGATIAAVAARRHSARSVARRRSITAAPLLSNYPAVECELPKSNRPVAPDTRTKFADVWMGDQ
jgi:hypothetical protein